MLTLDIVVFYVRLVFWGNVWCLKPTMSQWLRPHRESFFLPAKFLSAHVYTPLKSSLYMSEEKIRCSISQDNAECLSKGEHGLVDCSCSSVSFSCCRCIFLLYFCSWFSSLAAQCGEKKDDGNKTSHAEHCCSKWPFVRIVCAFVCGLCQLLKDK